MLDETEQRPAVQVAMLQFLPAADDLDAQPVEIVGTPDRQAMAAIVGRIAHWMDGQLAEKQIDIVLDPVSQILEINSNTR